MDKSEILKSYTKRFIDAMPHPKEWLKQIDKLHKKAKDNPKQSLEWSICMTQMLLFILEIYLQTVTDNKGD